MVNLIQHLTVQRPRYWTIKLSSSRTQNAIHFRNRFPSSSAPLCAFRVPTDLLFEKNWHLYCACENCLIIIRQWNGTLPRSAPLLQIPDIGTVIELQGRTVQTLLVTAREVCKTMCCVLHSSGNGFRQRESFNCVQPLCIALPATVIQNCCFQLNWILFKNKPTRNRNSSCM